ncbi:MAG: hypothetical protein JJ992_04850, partial [Planctomycetes bacterium]|nr:hypothetical protein [Planctomycetota bacterium]
HLSPRLGSAQAGGGQVGGSGLQAVWGLDQHHATATWTDQDFSDRGSIADLQALMTRRAGY